MTVGRKLDHLTSSLIFVQSYITVDLFIWVQFFSKVIHAKDVINLALQFIDQLFCGLLRCH